MVVNGKKMLKKHPRDQRRVPFVGNVRSHDCDARDIMFGVNKALAHARAHVTVRLTKMGYTGEGNLTGVMSENASAEELLNYAPELDTVCISISWVTKSHITVLSPVIRTIWMRRRS
jgi:hypothetical protein